MSRAPSVLSGLVAAAGVLAAVSFTFLRARPHVDFGAPAMSTGAAQYVVLVALDTLRADHLGSFGYPRPTTPNLDRLAARSAVFTQAYSPAPATLPAQMSLMTGVLPRTHMVRFAKDALDESFITLAEKLANGGFRTAGFTDGMFVGRQYGFGAGFERYDDDLRDGWMRNNGLRRRLPAIVDWVRKKHRERFFLFVHSYDCTGPYTVDADAKAALAGTQPVLPAGIERFGDPWTYLKGLRIHDGHKLDEFANLADLVDAYDSTIRFVDGRVGALIDELEQLGIFDRTLFIVTSDHGESFLDHDLYVGHGLTLYDEEVHVPLIVKFPGDRFAGTRCDDVVRLIDVYPTICAAAGLETPPMVEGADLALALEGKDAQPRLAAGESPNLTAAGVEGLPGQTWYARRGTLKYIDPPRIDLETLVRNHLNRNLEGEGAYDLAADPLRMAERVPFVPQLYDLAHDPGERENLAAARPDDVKALRDAIAATHDACLLKWTRLVNTPGGESSDTEESLQTLLDAGYIPIAEYERRVKEVRRRILQEQLDHKAREDRKARDHENENSDDG